MEKIIKFCREKYKILIPLMVVLGLLITVYFLYREYKYDNYRNKEEVKVYQHFGGIKTSYTAIVTRNLRNVIVDVDAKKEKIQYDATPIYYKDEEKVLFPSEMGIAFPLKEGSQYKVYKYTLYEYMDGVHMLNIASNEKDYNNFFLYDGKGLYFFPDAVTINIDDKEYKELSKMSYVNLVGGYTLTYYDKESDTSEIIEVEGKKITVTSDNININLSSKYLLSFGNKVLLAKPDNLNAVSN